MKLFILLSLFPVLTTTAMAQINKGQFLIGGNISFESIKNEGTDAAHYKTTNFFISPNIGYFIVPKFAGGLRINLSVYTEKLPVNFTQTTTSLSPFLRYYLLSIKQKFNVLIDVGYINFKSKFNNQSSSVSTERTNGYNISAGPALFINQHVAVEFILGYKRTKVKNADNENSTFNSGLGLQIHLGRIKTKSKT